MKHEVKASSSQLVGTNTKIHNFSSNIYNEERRYINQTINAYGL
jgi:hypothetical protein